MRLMMTGPAGYTGKGIVEVLRAKKHWVRGFLHRAKEVELDDQIVGSLDDMDACLAAVDGVDAVIMCHMAPAPDAYDTPDLAFDINVKGTANLYHAMVEKGVKKCVNIGSRATLIDNHVPVESVGMGPYSYKGKNLYPLTKVLCENIARYYYTMHDIATAVMRPSYICYDETLINKYGDELKRYGAALCDPRDIGTATHLALELKDLACEGFDLGLDGDRIDLRPAHNRLGWHPKYTFDSVPREK
jgi:nucleoside-diphosphate-sugar epimerase